MVTIKDVARLAGVSIATVSRTTAEPDKVTAATRRRVLTAIEDTGYVANTLARNFRRRRSNTVLVLVPDIANPFFSNIIQGIETAASSSHYRVLLGDTCRDPERERAHRELVSHRLADGVICLSRDIPFPTYGKGNSLQSDWPPIVMACEYHGKLPVPSVCIDNQAAAREAVEHLLKLGHRDIAFINGPKDSPLCLDRLAGYRKALQSAGTTPRKNRVKHGDFSLHSGLASMQSLLTGRERPTAVFCANDEMAIGAMQACRQAGVNIPDQMSVIGFDDIAFAAYTHPPLSTVHQPRNEIGERVMALMLSILAGGLPEHHRVVLPHKLIIRESTARANRLSV